MKLKLNFLLFEVAIMFFFTGCMTAYYTEEVVDIEKAEYWQKPFSLENEGGYYLGTQEVWFDDGGGVKSGLYDVFVFKNLIETESDKYTKIALPHDETDWSEDEEVRSAIRLPGGEKIDRMRTPMEDDFDKSDWKEPDGLLLIEGSAEDFDEAKSLADARIYVADESTKVLFLTCSYRSPNDNRYKFAFFVSQKDLMKAHGKRRGFPKYLFLYLGYPATVLLDVVTSPIQFLVWWLFHDFHWGA